VSTTPRLHSHPHARVSSNTLKCRTLACPAHLTPPPARARVPSTRCAALHQSDPASPIFTALL
ncbi:hypothetical protein B0H10DRAFT_2103327, partial [Mycena sp. CBHHK59/15]